MGLQLLRAIGVVNGVNTDFTSPVPYAPGTMFVFRNGALLDRDSDNGWIELNPPLGSFRLKVAPLPAGPGLDDAGDFIDCAFFTSGTELVLGGADGGCPRLLAADNIDPKVVATHIFKPKLRTDPEEDPVPRLADAAEDGPKVAAADIKPKLVDAKDVT